MDLLQDGYAVLLLGAALALAFGLPAVLVVIYILLYGGLLATLP